MSFDINKIKRANVSFLTYWLRRLALALKLYIRIPIISSAYLSHQSCFPAYISGRKVGNYAFACLCLLWFQSCYGISGNVPSRGYQPSITSFSSKIAFLENYPTPIFYGAAFYSEMLLHFNSRRVLSPRHIAHSSRKYLYNKFFPLPNMADIGIWQIGNFHCHIQNNMGKK